MEILRTTRPAALLGALATLLAGCGSAVDPMAPREVESRVVVHSVLQEGADTVMVLLTRTSSHFYQVYPDQAAPVSGAVVRLGAGSDTVQLVERSGAESRCIERAGQPVGGGGAGCYLALLPGGVRAGESYGLRIEIPGHEVIQGQATIPAPPALLEPVPLAALAVGATPVLGQGLEPVPLRWAPVEPGQRLELRLRIREEGCWLTIEVARQLGDYYFGIDLTGQETAAIESRWLHCGGGALGESYPADLYLTAFDSVYTRYIEQNTSYGSTPRGRASAGVTGALGVFAGAASTRVPVTLLVRAGAAGSAPTRSEAAQYPLDLPRVAPLVGRDLLELDHQLDLAEVLGQPGMLGIAP